jgi:PadR family transcriptional regulator PadR
MKFERELLKGIAPVVVLEVLSRGRMYGYELSEAISAKSQNILTLGQGTLYPLLYNLEAQKLIKGQWETAPSGRERRYYSITSRGKERLDTDKVQLADLFRALKLVFGTSIIPA